MTTYKVFNANNVLKQVSDEDLDHAARASGPLLTKIANAAAVARRSDLASRLIATLDIGPRLQRLAAANALLELEHAEAVPALEALAKIEADGVTAGMFRATALRLRGVDLLRSAWERADDPALCDLIPSMYNSQFALSAGDFALITAILSSYVDKDRPWIIALSKDEWRSAVGVLIDRISAEVAQPIRQRLEAAVSARLRDVLECIWSSEADSQTRASAKRVLRDWAAAG
jgi:hypothetical protein